MIKTAILDVTKIEPRLKHPTIFEHFDALEQGESFTILNDHDPRPLYYQLLGERGNYFRWEYIESGPEWWQVVIAKPATAEKEETIGEVAAADMRKAERLKKLGIDFCCGGKMSLKDAAASIGLSKEELQAQLSDAEKQESTQQALHFDKWDLAFLADYIQNEHHSYVREYGPIIEQLADKVALRHGNEHPELPQLAHNLHGFMSELYAHLQKEEEQLFPVTRTASGTNAKEVISTLEELQKEHEEAGGELVEFRKITQDYQLPANACNSYTYLYERIQAFEQNLFQHIHLENNILFPKLKSSYQQLPN